MYRMCWTISYVKPIWLTADLPLLKITQGRCAHSLQQSIQPHLEAIAQRHGKSSSWFGLTIRVFRNEQHLLIMGRQMGCTGRKASP